MDSEVKVKTAIGTVIIKSQEMLQLGKNEVGFLEGKRKHHQQGVFMQGGIINAGWGGTAKMGINGCTLCELTRKSIVKGNGNPKARLMIIGEAPGEEEDLQGKPFVGRSGKLLNATLAKMGIKREDIYVTNIMKCHPPGNRRPLQTEIDNCTMYLLEEIRSVDPEVIATLGLSAANWFLPGETMGEMNGRVFNIQINDKSRKIVPVYHPSAVLRNPNIKDSFERAMKVAIEESREVMKINEGDFVAAAADGFIRKARKNDRPVGTVVNKDTFTSGTIVKMKTKDGTEYWVTITGYVPEFVEVKP